MSKKLFEETDKKIRETLMKKTDSALELKTEIWNQIEKRINEDNISEYRKLNEEPIDHQQEITKRFKREIEGKNHKTKGRIKMKTEKRNRNNLRRIFGMGTVAAALILVFLAGTTPGHAAIERIKEFFVPEKPIVEEIEGMKEEKNVQLQESEMGYIIYFDETVYTLEKVENKDRIFPKGHPANYPPVFMEIEQFMDKDITTLVSEIESDLKEQYQIFRNEGKVDSPIESILLYGRNGDQWNDEVVRYYFVDNTEGGTFVIKQQFFYEASEGYGVRLDNILKEFKIVKLQN